MEQDRFKSTVFCTEGCFSVAVRDLFDDFQWHGSDFMTADSVTVFLVKFIDHIARAVVDPVFFVEMHTTVKQFHGSVSTV